MTAANAAYPLPEHFRTFEKRFGTSPLCQMPTLVDAAANFRFEPILPIFCNAANGRYHRKGINLQQLLGFGTGFLVASSEVVYASSINERLRNSHEWRSAGKAAP